MLAVVPQLWKRIRAQFAYIHGMGAKSAHFLHKPAPLLHDVGFELLPELGKGNGYPSEYIFLIMFISFILWTFHPFVTRHKQISTVLVWHKALLVLVICQSFRMASFTATQLPGPNYHCHLGSPSATLPPPENVLDVVLLNIPKGAVMGCGDLIFSSHMTFTLVFHLSYNKHGTSRWIIRLGWLLLVAQSLLIIAARKHYSVDVVIAWYVVPLVFFFVDRKLNEGAGRLSLIGVQLDDKGVTKGPVITHSMSNTAEERSLLGSDSYYISISHPVGHQAVPARPSRTSAHDLSSGSNSGS
eukprot:SM000359S13451  [mRNA]  locus=s359:114:3183:+ [translate_table: standard]